MPRAPETDLSGRVIPTGRQSSIDRILAVPPIRDRPNDDSTELLISAWNVLLVGAGYTPLWVAAAGGPTVVQFDQQSRARIDSIAFFCPDMVTAASPLIHFTIVVNGQPLPAWNQVPIWPRAGIASVSFDAAIIIPPNAQLTVLSENLDVANHFVGVYLRGWNWPKDLIQG